MVSLASHGNQRLHRCRLAGGNIGGAQVSVVGEHSFGFAQNFYHRNDLVQHRFELLLVVGGLHHVNGHHQQAALGHHRMQIGNLRSPRWGRSPRWWLS